MKMLLTLQESVVDMLAVRWERRLGGDLTVTAAQLADIPAVFLQRYTEGDRERVRILLDKIATSEL